MTKVLKAVVHGDGDLFNNYAELQEALVWVYFHSNIPEFNKVECWGPLRDAYGGPRKRWRRKKVLEARRVGDSSAMPRRMRVLLSPNDVEPNSVVSRSSQSPCEPCDGMEPRQKLHVTFSGFMPKLV
ncbi:Protein STAY-GREEN 1 [Vigna angularis]|uniref:Protein STAY-GREEN 1 n=1 Tax=Phaseolus angularis TaxID=3914 RepID=A0A8T0LJF8_PHAAN|nr:Protein STAY-GREEN 1 [Vigna angularis]